MITKAIDPAYDEAASWPLWDAFLIRTFPDEEVRAYVKRAVGYCLTGSMVEQCLLMEKVKTAKKGQSVLWLLDGYLAKKRKNAECPPGELQEAG